MWLSDEIFRIAIIRNAKESAKALLVATLHVRAYGGYQACGRVGALLRDVHARENVRLLLLNHVDEWGHHGCGCAREISRYGHGSGNVPH